jgi:hypothetical protein
VADPMRLAEMMASAKLVPAPLQKSPADCLMVIQQAVRCHRWVRAVAAARASQDVGGRPGLTTTNNPVLSSPPYSGGLYFELTDVAQGFELA